MGPSAHPRTTRRRRPGRVRNFCRAAASTSLFASLLFTLGCGRSADDYVEYSQTATPDETTATVEKPDSEPAVGTVSDGTVSDGTVSDGIAEPSLITHDSASAVGNNSHNPLSADSGNTSSPADDAVPVNVAETSQQTTGEVPAISKTVTPATEPEQAATKPKVGDTAATDTAATDKTVTEPTTAQPTVNEAAVATTGVVQSDATSTETPSTTVPLESSEAVASSSETVSSEDVTADAGSQDTSQTVSSDILQTSVVVRDLDRPLRNGDPDLRADPADPAASTEPREIQLLIPEKSFRMEKNSKAIRVSYDDIDLLKILNMEPVPVDAVNHFPGWLNALNGSLIRIRGFMYPTYQATGLTGFTLARDNGICCFVRQPKIYDIIAIELADGVTSDYIEGKPFDVEGVFRIEPEADETELYRLYTIENARVIR